MFSNIPPHISYPAFKDYKNRQKINILLELKIKLIKFILLDFRLKYNLKFLLKMKYLSKFGKKYSNKIRMYCIMSGKSRYIFSFFNLSRAALKYYSSFGLISGFKRG